MKVPRTRVELVTRGSSIHCSTTELSGLILTIIEYTIIKLEKQHYFKLIEKYYNLINCWNLYFFFKKLATIYTVINFTILNLIIH